MNKLEKVAKLLNISVSEVENYLIIVQEYIKKPVSIDVIEDCLINLPNEITGPEDLAKMIQQIYQDDISLLEKGKSDMTATSPSPITGSMLPLYTKTENYIDQKPYNYDPRNFINELGVCPHGVPKIRICAICDPEGFKMETGID